MPVIVPATSEVNFTPSSTDESAPPSTREGTVELDQIVTGVATAFATAILKLLVVVWLVASESRVIKLKVPEAVGVPEIAPVLGIRTSPPGNDPLEIDQVYGVVPPEPARDAE